MNASVSEHLIEICARPIEPADRERAAWHLLDWLGCALIGATSPAGTALAAYGTDDAGACFAAGTNGRSAGEAAFVNGGLGNIFELDDVHRTAILHAGDVVVPAALAAAQRHGADGHALLDAIVQGYEVAIRIGSAAASNGYSAWYNSGTCGVFGAAMAAGSVLNLDPGRLADALGQAGMQASGIWQCRLEPTFSKQLATAHAARAGLVSADLARAGFPGARYILEGELGFFEAYYPRADRTLVLATPDAPWKISEVSFKPWPACRHAHPAIEAALALRDTTGPDRIARITISTYDAAIDFCDEAHPKSDHDARFSLQHCVATALLRGAPDLDDFGSTARADQAIADLRHKVSLVPDAEFTGRFPQAYGARVEIEFSDALKAAETVITAKGDPENPMSATELEAKFMTLARQAGIDAALAGEMPGLVSALAGGDGLERFSQHLAQLSDNLNSKAP